MSVTFSCRVLKNHFTGLPEPGQKNFTYVYLLKTWYDARDYCRQHYTDLAMIQDETENSKVASFHPDYVWIGLYREPWRWSDNTPVKFTNWQSLDVDVSNKDCAAETSAHLWITVSCAATLPFFCHTGKALLKRIHDGRVVSVLHLNHRAVLLKLVVLSFFRWYMRTSQM